MAIFSERRKHPRVPYSNTLKVQKVSSSKIGNVFEVQADALKGAAQDIGEGGFRVELPTNLKPGAILKLIFKVGARDAEMSEAYVRVVWSDKEEHGVQFLMLEDMTLRKIRVFISDISER